MPLTGVVTVTVHVATFPPSTLAAVITVIPPETGVTMPLFTVATDRFELPQFTILLLAFDGVIVALSVVVAPPAIKLADVGFKPIVLT